MLTDFPHCTISFSVCTADRSQRCEENPNSVAVIKTIVLPFTQKACQIYLYVPVRAEAHQDTLSESVVFHPACLGIELGSSGSGEDPSPIGLSHQRTVLVIFVF